MSLLVIISYSSIIYLKYILKYQMNQIILKNKIIHFSFLLKLSLKKNLIYILLY